MVLILPPDLLIGAFLAALIHECCHLILLYFFHIPVITIEIGIMGATIRTCPFPPHQELICTLAGPAGSLLCALFFQRFPLFALCGLIQGIYNLLPIYPLDGGRILRCIFQLILPEHAERICAIVKRITIIAISLGCLWLAIRTLDQFFLLLPVYFLLQTVCRRKIPCKRN